MTAFYIHVDDITGCHWRCCQVGAGGREGVRSRRSICHASTFWWV